MAYKRLILVWFTSILYYMDLQKLGEKHQKDNIDLILTVNKNIYMLDSGRL